AQKLPQEALAQERPQAEGPFAKTVPVVALKDVSDLAGQQSAWHAFFAIELLKLGGRRVTDLEVALDQAQQGKPGPNWLALGKLLRQEWTSKLPAAYQQASDDLTLAERLSYLITPYEKEPGGPPWLHNPTLALNQKRHHEFW